MTQDDQRSTDLDAALDAVIPSLTAVDDDAAAQSLRRTRIALAEPRASASTLRGWRWAMPAAAAAAAAILAAVVFWPRPDVSDPTKAAVRTSAPAPAALPAARPPVAPFAPAPKRVPARAVRAPQVAATSTALRPDDSPRPDPLIALVRAVQAIPEDAWKRGTNAADAPVTIEPIVVSPIETPALPDLAPEPVAPGEP